MKRITSLFEAMQDTARRKSAAAGARFAGQLPEVESPAVVYADACESIASAFAGEGFRFAKSGPHFTRKAGDLTFRVRFQSSHHNIAGEYVALWIHANVASKRLKKWREDKGPPCGSNDHVAGGQIGNLIANHSWLEWNLAGAGSRDAEIDSAILAIRQLALPLFEGFDDVPQLCRRLALEDIAGFDLLNAFEFLACFDSLDAARAMLVRFLSQSPGLLEAYDGQLQRFTSEGLPSHYLTRHDEVLAATSIKFHLGDLREA